MNIPIIDFKNFPIIPHSTTGIDCCGCLITTDTNPVLLLCNECGSSVGSIDFNVLQDIISFVDTKLV